MLLSVKDIIGRADKPSEFKIEEIRVLRAANGLLPVNHQVGATCAIYALDAGLQIRGQMIAPPRKRDVPGYWSSQSHILSPSIRQQAKPTRSHRPKSNSDANRYLAPKDDPGRVRETLEISHAYPDRLNR
jgi:hypothetical protein